MRIAKDELVAALGLRYDHYSATTIFEAARSRADLADKSDYDGAELAAFRAALARVGDRLERVNERLDALTGTSPQPAPASPSLEAKPEASGAAPEATPEAPIEAKPEAKPEPEEPKADAPSKKKKKASATDATPTLVSLRGLELAAGDELLMCGDFVGWDVEQARPLTRAGDRWQASLELDPGTEVAFKFLRRSASGDVAWEPGENRTVVGGAKLDATWRSARIDD